MLGVPGARQMLRKEKEPPQYNPKSDWDKQVRGAELLAILINCGSLNDLAVVDNCETGRGRYVQEIGL